MSLLTPTRRNLRLGRKRRLRFKNWLLFILLCLLASALAMPLVVQRAESNPQQTAEVQLSATALQQIAALEAETRTRTPTQLKIDSHLLAAGKIMRGQAVAEGVPSIRTGVETDSAGRVLVDIDALVTDELLKQIETGGGEIVNSFPQFNSIRAQVPLGQIELLAGQSDIKFIHLALLAELMSAPNSQHLRQPISSLSPASGLSSTRTSRVDSVRSQLPAALADRSTRQMSDDRQFPNAGSVTTEGDKTHRADAARATFGVDGTGVKIGVLSDSVDFLSASQANGNLGSVTVLTGQSGVPATGEGTAMLEIIHDLAPGAQLFFATANGGSAAFAQNILNLRAAGCDIIVDDEMYPNESPFQDDIISQAVNSVTASGAIYFSSAGNSGNFDDGKSGVWEGDFVDGGAVSIGGQPAGRIHSFGSSTSNTVLAGGDSAHLRVNLFWSEPLGSSATDYNVYVLDSGGTNVVASSTNPQTGTQDPYETIATLSVGEKIIIVKSSGAARFLHLDTGRGVLSIPTVGQTRGHSCAVAAFGVAATPVASAYPNPFNSFNVSETFSSDGPRRVFFNADGSAITPGNFSSTGGTVRQKPDITAADGVTTSLPPGVLNPFFGTSAAAPHAAAIAGLLKSFRPSLTPAQIRTALISTAIDIEAPGVDRDTGAGIVMAYQALQSLPSPNLTPYQPTGWSDKIVVSNTTGTNTDSSPLKPTDTLYVDWAVLNNGTAATDTSFFYKLFVDGVERNTWVTNPPLNVNFFASIQDYSIGNLGAGTHTIKIVADATGVIPESNELDNEYTKTITVIGPNLTPYQPAGWSDKIVVSNTTGTSTDNSPLKTTDTLYIDWAVLNNGTAATEGTFLTKLFVDGVERISWSSPPPLNVNFYANIQDYSIGTLSAGVHTIKIVADATGVIPESNELDNEYTKTITVVAANLTPYQPVGWSDKIVVSNVTGTTTDSSPLKSTDTLYVDWAVVNNGTADISSTFNEKLYVDGIERVTFVTNPPLNINSYTFIQDYSIGLLSAGTHTVKIVADSGGAISESNESDNEYTKTITVTDAQPPLQLLLDQSGPAPDQVAALDSILFLRDPFPVINGADLLNLGIDRNTRVVVFAMNLQLAQGETSSSVVVNLVDSNNQNHDVAAEDVRAVPNVPFTQVIFRLPDNLPAGTCTIKLKAHGQVSNLGTMRIRA